MKSFLYKAYKILISPVLTLLFGHACRFTPTCSTYAFLAVKKYGWVKGGWLSMKRIAKCHPFTPLTYDPLI